MRLCVPYVRQPFHCQRRLRLGDPVLPVARAGQVRITDASMVAPIISNWGCTRWLTILFRLRPEETVSKWELVEGLRGVSVAFYFLHMYTHTCLHMNTDTHVHRNTKLLYMYSRTPHTCALSHLYSLAPIDPLTCYSSTKIFLYTLHKCFCCISEQQCCMRTSNFCTSYGSAFVTFLNSDRAEQFRRCFPQYARACVPGCQRCQL